MPLNPAIKKLVDDAKLKYRSGDKRQLFPAEILMSELATIGLERASKAELKQLVRSAADREIAAAYAEAELRLAYLDEGWNEYQHEKNGEKSID